MAERMTEETMARLRELITKLGGVTYKRAGSSGDASDWWCCTSCGAKTRDPERGSDNTHFSHCKSHIARRAINLLSDTIASQQKDIAALVGVVKKLYKNTGIIDNGNCAVCRCGHRLWKARKTKSDPSVPGGPCSNDECLSRVIDALLANLSSAAEAHDRRVKAEGAAEALETLLLEEDWLYPEVRHEINRRAEAARLREDIKEKNETD